LRDAEKIRAVAKGGSSWWTGCERAGSRGASRPCARLGLAGCATTPIEKREWIAVRTAHYDVWSSLGERRAPSARASSSSVSAARWHIVWGSALPEEPARTRVYAFDDRSFPRKFAYEHQRSFLLRASAAT
jgi:hypothetical protein